MGGLYACGATFQYMVPLPNFVITLLFSKMRLKRKDFQEIVRLTREQECHGPRILLTQRLNAVCWED